MQTQTTRISTEAKAPSASERRQSRRLPINVLVEYEDRQDFLTDYTANMDIGGMFIKTSTPLEMGTRFRLRFKVSGRDKPIYTVAVVRWNLHPSEAGPLNAGMGVQFERLGQSDEAAVQSMLDEWA